MGSGLTPERARSVYDRIGQLQDWQSFYESKALNELIIHGEFDSARAVFELGCGTGAFAERLLRHHLPLDASYVGVDVSDTMVRLAEARLEEWPDRCRIVQTDGRLPLPGSDASFDRFIATYVFDLLPEDYAGEILDEARRLLTADGLLCAASLTRGRKPAEKALCTAWEWVAKRSPALLGGCRPIELGQYLGPSWEILYRTVVSAFAVPTEVVIARPGHS
ncbi:MAG: class I SAM-dependent methyltransferase [Acidimicrobiia bacterium]